MSTTHAAIPLVTRTAIVRAVALGLESLRARPPIKLSDWAQQHFVLAGESSQQRGGWKAWPFQVGIMDAMADDDIEELTVFKSKRIGYTKMLTASICFDAAYRRRNQVLYQPTDDDRDSFVKSELDPVLDGVAAVREARKVTGGEDTMKYKQFRDSVVHCLGAKAARAFRRITVAAAKLDEVDAMDRVVEKTIDPITGARGRLEGAAFPKLIAGSTPRIKGLSHVEDRAAVADVVMQYRITCMHCGVEHPLMWGGPQVPYGMKWDRGEPTTVRHVCPHCHGAITQADYLRNWQGAWVCHNTGIRYGADQTWRNADGQPIKPPRHVTMRPWAAYSPQREWVDIVREFLQATAKAKAGDKGALQGFVNETLGETWEETGDGTDSHELERRAERYDLRTVPMGGLLLVAGVDVQDDRWEVVVWAVGVDEEMWAVDYAVIYGNPADEDEWSNKLDPYLMTPMRHASGAWLRIEAAAVDTGGHFTHQAYQFCRMRAARRVFAVKGDGAEGKPIAGKPSAQDVNWRGEIIRRGVKLWAVGTDTAKDLLHGRLHVKPPAVPGAPCAGYVHFSDRLPAEFYAGLTAEQRVRMKTATGESYRWVNPRRLRNEPLDCTVYALFCISRLGLDRYTSTMWQRLAAAVRPQPQMDLLAEEVPAPAIEPETEAPEPTAPPPAAPAVVSAFAGKQQQRRRVIGRIGGASWGMR